MSMALERPAFAFRWLLPITQLLLCVVVLWPLRTVLVQDVRDSIHAYRPRRNPPSAPPEEEQMIVIPLNSQRQLIFEQEQATLERQWVPITLNLPCGLVQLPFIISNPAKQEWIPRGMNFKTWRVISWPLAGLLFWWIAGRGIEGLIAARQRLIYPRITWLETIIGAGLCGFCAVAAVCLPLFTAPDVHFPMKLFVAALGMWAALGGVTVAARVMQWRQRRQTNLNDPTGVSPTPSAG
jgi:hypothetical protein